MEVAREELGTAEVPGPGDNPRVLGYLSSCERGSRPFLARDATPWCSAFANFCMREIGLPRTRSLAARSWLKYGRHCEYRYGAIVVLWRGVRVSANVINAPGHVGFLDRWDETRVWLLGGNQGDRVSIRPYPRERVLAVRFPTDEAMAMHRLLKVEA